MRTYVPDDILSELFNIKKEKKVKKNADAFRHMAAYSKIGRRMLSDTQLDRVITDKDLKKFMRLKGGF